ncbi:MAG: hypothetical protein JNM22_02740 [Saprospiraceae bacterium]|nr:hypothetical protein [Saprospiraceae bacterium]
MTKSKWIIYSLLVLLPGLSQAQSALFPEIFQKGVRESAQDTHRLQRLLKLGQHYLYRQGNAQSDLDSAFLYFNEAKRLCEMLHATEELKKTMVLLIKSYNEAKDQQTVRRLCYSLIGQYRASGDANAEAEIWHWIGTNSEQTDTMLYALDQAGRCYGLAKNVEKQAETLKETADIHLVQGKLAQSEEELLRVLDMYKSVGFNKLHFTYDLLTSVSIQRGNLNRAVYYGQETIKSMYATGDSAVAQTFYSRLARIYFLLGQTEQNVEWLKKAYSKANDANMVSLARGLIKLGKVQEALKMAQDYIRRSPPQTTMDRTFIATTLGDCYDALKQYDLAEKYYQDMVRYERLLKQENEYTVLVYLTMGKFYVERHRYKTAAPYLKKVLAIPAGISSPHRLKDAHLLLFQVDSAAGNYLSAIRHLQIHKFLNDSIFNVTKSRQIEEFQIQYETEKKEKDIAVLQNESTLQESRLKEATLAKNLTFVGGTMLLVILGLLYNRYRLKQRSNRRLELQQVEINNTNRSLQNLLEEKELLLREIHHRVKNNLQIVMSLLNTQSIYLHDEAALHAIRDSRQRIHSISLIHKKLYQSDSVARINMPVYIQELVEYLDESYQTEGRLRFHLQIEPIELDVTQAVPVGLILNEAISNAVKYAFPDNRPGTVSISMKHNEADQYELTISDNGTGLPPGFDPAKSASLGMSLMRGLSKQLHGSFDMQNEQGLTIRILFANDKTFPLTARPNAPEATMA